MIPTSGWTRRVLDQAHFEQDQQRAEWAPKNLLPTMPECRRQHRLAGVREEIERRAAGSRTRRSPFDHFVEAAYQQVSRPPFFLICVAIIVG